MNPSIFNFNNHDVRVALDASGEPWFCVTDVYKSLDISRTSRCLKKYGECNHVESNQF